MRPEHQILIDFLNNRFEISDLASLTPEHWNTLVSEASRHRIAPLIYRKVKQAATEWMIPEDVVLKFREKYLANAYRNTVLFHQLTELLARLNNKDIPVILLKGAHLAEFVYKDMALRPMSDLDIMVREEHLSEAVQVAFSAGYQFFYEKKNAKEKSNASYCYDILKYYKHFQPLIHPETNCLLEIHCFIAEVGSSFQIPASELWRNALPEVFNYNEVFLLSPEDLIIHLCLHASYDHLFDFGLSALYDIALTIKYYGQNLDWDKVQHRSGQWRTNQCLLLSLYLTKKWLDANIPDAIFKNFSVDEIVTIAEARIFKTSEISTSMHPHYIQWRNRKGICAKIRYVLGVLFPSRDFMANRYLQPKSSRIIFGSYFFRFFQVFKGIRDIAKAMLQDEHYAPRLKRGDNDFRLRKWLTKS